MFTKNMLILFAISEIINFVNDKVSCFRPNAILLNAKRSLTVWALYAYFSDSQNAAFEFLVWCM